MAMLTIDAWMVAWNPKRGTSDPVETTEFPDGAVKVGPWPDTTGWSRHYDSTAGCCDTARHAMDHWQKIALLFVDFHHLVVGGGIDPIAAHREFLQIDEFRRVLAPDAEGAEQDAKQQDRVPVAN